MPAKRCLSEAQVWGKQGGGRVPLRPQHISVSESGPFDSCLCNVRTAISRVHELKSHIILHSQGSAKFWRPVLLLVDLFGPPLVISLT